MIKNNGMCLIYLFLKVSINYEGRFFLCTSSAVFVCKIFKQVFLRLTCTSGKELDVIKDLTALACSVGSYENPVVVFDAVNSVYPINHLTAIQIRRHVTTATTASDA